MRHKLHVFLWEARKHREIVLEQLTSVAEELHV